MSGLFLKGEKKERAGVYRRHEQITNNGVASAMNGVFCIPVHADFGPVGEVQKITSKTDLYSLYMESGTIDAAAALFSAGANTVYLYRLGTGGKEGSVSLQTTTSTNAVTLKTKYPTALKFSVTLKQKLGDATTKELSVYNGATLVEKVSFVAGTGVNEAANLVEAMKDSKYLYAELASGASGIMQTVTQQALTDGAAPNVTTEDYSNAFNAFEAYAWNVMILDTVEEDVKTLVKTYMDRIHSNGTLGICVLGETAGKSLATRLANAKAYNAPYFIYCGSGYYNTAGERVEGYLAAAVQGGVIGCKDSSTSIVHTEIPDAESCIEQLTNEQYVSAIKSGLLLLSEGQEGQVWFDSGVNTYTVLNEDDDEGWKKIKRTAIRYEAFDRINRTLEPLIGKISNTSDGVDNVIQEAKKVLAEMNREGKILDTYEFFEDTDNTHAVDYAYFIIRIDDVDSMEKIYLTYQFQYISQ